MKTFFTVIFYIFAAVWLCAQQSGNKAAALGSNTTASQEPPEMLKEVDLNTSPDNPAVLKMPEGAGVELKVGQMPQFGANVKLDTSSEAELQTTFLQICVGLDERELDLLNRAYTALLYKYTADGSEGVKELMKILNGKTAAEVIEMGTPYVKELPRDHKFDASSEEKFQISLTFAMMTLDKQERKELAGAVAKVILRGARQGKEPGESIKVLHHMTSDQIIDYAEQIHDVSLPENL